MRWGWIWINNEQMGAISFGLWIQAIVFLVHCMAKHNLYISKLTILYATNTHGIVSNEQAHRFVYTVQMLIWMFKRMPNTYVIYNNNQQQSSSQTAIHHQPELLMSNGIVLHKYIVFSLTICKNHINIVWTISGQKKKAKSNHRFTE